MAKSRIQFICQSCGNVTPRWGGKCEACGEWNTLVEEGTAGGIGSGPQSLRSPRKGRAVALTSLSGEIDDARAGDLAFLGDVADENDGGTCGFRVADV